MSLIFIMDLDILGMGDIYRCTHLFTIFKEKNIKLLKNRFQNEKNQVVKKIVFLIPRKVLSWQKNRFCYRKLVSLM